MKFFKKIIEYILYLFVFFLPWQSRFIFKTAFIKGKYFEYGTYSIYFTDILLMLLFLFSLFVFSKMLFSFSEEKLLFKIKKPFLLSLAFFDFFIFLSCFLAEDRFLAFYKYLWFLSGIFLFFLLSFFPYQRIKLFFFFLGGVFFESFLAIYQFLFQSSFAFKYFGLSRHIAGEPGSSVIETLNRERWLRAYGGLSHPNILGGFLVLAILILVLYKKDIFYKNNFISFFIFNLLLSLFSLALIFSFSRGAYLALLFSLFLMLIISFVKKEKLMQINILKSGFIIFIIFINIFLFYPSLFKTRMAFSTRLELKSKNERVEGYKDVFKIIKDNLWFGVGMGNYTLALKNELLNKEVYFYQPVHNVFLLILAEIGLFGFISFLVFLFSFFYFLSFKNVYVWSLFLALIILFNLDHYFFSLHFGILLFFTILGILTRREYVFKNT